MVILKARCLCIQAPGITELASPLSPSELHSDHGSTCWMEQAVIVNDRSQYLIFHYFPSQLIFFCELKFGMSYHKIHALLQWLSSWISFLRLVSQDDQSKGAVLLTQTLHLLCLPLVTLFYLFISFIGVT